MNKKIDISHVILKTDRLILRPWKEMDLDDFYEYASVDRVGQMAGWLPHKSIQETQKILSIFIDNRQTFAIEMQGKVIGSIEVKQYKESSYPELENIQGRELGYVLSQSYWGQGIMPEAVKAVIEYLFKIENYDFILCGSYEENKQSARVIEKCGFQYYKTIELTNSYGETKIANDSILCNLSIK